MPLGRLAKVDFAMPPDLAMPPDSLATIETSFLQSFLIVVAMPASLLLPSSPSLVTILASLLSPSSLSLVAIAAMLSSASRPRIPTPD